MGIAILKKELSLAVLISGRGSNLQAIIEACQNPDFPARIEAVISNKADVYGLERARAAGIETCVVEHGGRPKAVFEAALHDAISDYDVNLICLAGFMRILSAEFIAKWPNKIINIHPSLLPKHKGLDTHQRAIDAGDSQSGCSVHYVAAEMDSGEIIIQKGVAIHDGDTPETLAARVLEQEHIAYPEAIESLARKKSKT